MNNLIIIAHPNKESFCYSGIYKTILLTLLKKNESVKEVLKRLHSRESGVDTVDTMEETTTNNDRLVSDTMSDTKKKKKNLMVVT